ncbi:MAG: hypothetical protein NTW38_01020 [Candidatus Aminicenantes bacterium]|nr:hypothetical protein [Candidatus Aminicenantes bacterium]
MKKLWNRRFGLALVMIGTSAAIYFADYLIFGRPREIFSGLVGDIAFLFIYILVVILVIDDVLARREKKARLKKMNMVIGSFFSAVGRDLLMKFPLFVDNAAELAPKLAFDGRWDKNAFARAGKTAESFPYRVRVKPDSLRNLRACLTANRGFLLGLLENPNLLEHESFTDLLWAVFHLVEELEMRPESLEGLPAADYAHLAGDVQRAYSRLAGEWLAYARHLQEDYPYLFSLAARINPFRESPTPVIRD